MKTTYLFGLLFSLSFSLFASEADESLLCLNNQLTAHNWEGERGIVWQFNVDGHLLRLDAATPQVQHGQWTVEKVADQFMLRISLHNGPTYWSLEADCSQTHLRLANQAEVMIQLKAMPTRQAARQWLSGDWQEGVYAQTPLFTFNADGSYQRLQEGTDELTLTTGHWMLSKDGNTLLLYRPEGKLEAFAIRHLNMDELVLRAYQAGANDRFLNKL